MSEGKDEGPESTRPPSLQENQRLGHFRLRRPLGRGGMGEVWLAWDEHLDRDVVIKVLRSDAADRPLARQRFRREAYALSRVSHSDIATIFDFDTQDGIDFLVMEFVEGETLAARLTRGALGPHEAIEVGRHVCRALVAAHEKGILHRDLSPRNVMITADGGVKVLDLGLAKLLRTDDVDAPTDTLPGPPHVVGTLPYVAPERLRGEEADERSDLYALGAILHEMITGRKLYAGTTPAQQIAATLERDVPPLASVAPGVDDELARCVDKALARDPAHRHASARDLAVDLERCRARSADGDLAAGPTRESRSIRERTALALVLVAVLITLAIGWMSWPQDTAPGSGLSESTSLQALITGPDIEMSSRISPDGEWIAYQSYAGGRSEILVMPLDGEVARSLVTADGPLDGEVWSPDGRRIAYVRLTDDRPLLQIQPAFGGPIERSVPLPAELERVVPVAWVEDVVHLDAGFAGLWAVDLRSGESRSVLAGQGQEGPRFEFDVCEDGEHAVYTVREAERFAIWVTRLQDGHTRRLTRHEHSDLRPRWTGPDCGFIVHTSNRSGQSDLWRTDLDGESERLTFGASIEYAESGSRDGTLLSYRVEVQGSDLWIFDPAKGARRLTADTLEDLAPSAAARGGRVVFQRRARSMDEFGPTFQARILSARLGPDGLVDHRTVAPRGGLAQVSPDGRWLAYARPIPRGRLELVVQDLESERAEAIDRPLALPILGTSPVAPLWTDLAWTSDPDRLVYVRHAPEGPQIRVWTPGFGQAPRTLVQVDGGSLRQPRLGRAGSVLAYLHEVPVGEGSDGSGPGLRTELRLLELATGEQTVLRQDRGGTSSLLRLAGQTADGQWILVRTDEPPTAPSTVVVGAVGPDGVHREIKALEGRVGSVALDGSRGVLVLSWTSPAEGVQNLHALELDTGQLQRLTEGDGENILFSDPFVLDDGRLLYTRQQRNSDIWLVRFGP